MNKRILTSLAILIFLTFGSTLLADPVTGTEYGYDNLIFIGISYQTPESAALTELNYSSLTYQGKWDGMDGEGWTINTDWEGTVGESGEYTEAQFVWNGSGVITHIVLKADGYYALFLLDNPLSPGDAQAISSDPSQYDPDFSGDVVLGLNSQGKPYAISHITGYGTTSVPEPATLVLLGLGLMAVPVARKFRF